MQISKYTLFLTFLVNAKNIKLLHCPDAEKIIAGNDANEPDVKKT